MRRFVPPALAAVAVVAAAAPAFALRVAMPIQTPGLLAVQSPVVVVGKVTAIEADTVEAEPYPGAPKTPFKVAVLKIEDGLAGAGSLTHLKVGFRPLQVEVAPVPGQPRLSSRPPQPTQLAVDQEGCFFLAKHPSAGFYVIAGFRGPLDAKAEGYKDELAEVKKAVGVINDPVKALKADKAEDRYFAAAVLLTKYRAANPSGAGGAVEQVAVPADESKLILKALAERDDWTPRGGRDMTFTPTAVMGNLGLSEADGYKPAPFNGQGDYGKYLRDNYRAWQTAHGGEYRVKRFVSKEK